MILKVGKRALTAAKSFFFGHTMTGSSSKIDYFGTTVCQLIPETYVETETLGYEHRKRTYRPTFLITSEGNVGFPKISPVRTKERLHT